MLKILKEAYTLRKNLLKDPLDLEGVQSFHLKNLVKYSYENVAYYRKIFDEAGLEPRDVKDVSDIVKLPMTKKEDIQSGNLLDFIASDVDIGMCRKTTTSGSTGLPLSVYADRRSGLIDDASWVRAHLERGLNVWDKMALLQDPRYFPSSPSYLERLRILRRRYISIFDDRETQLSRLEEYAPDVIRSYPSSLMILVNINGEVEVDPRLIFTSGELLDDYTRDKISSCFHGDLLDNYSSNELSLIAWECKEHSGYHINADTMIVETVRDGEPVAPGERGEIVCTKLFNYAMPLLRYRLGDTGVLSEERCSCGNPLPLIKIVEGRTDDFLLTTDGRIISPLVFFPYPFDDYVGIKQFRVIQERRDRIVIQIVLKDGFEESSVDLPSVIEDVQSVFGKDMNVVFKFLGELGIDSSGKIRKILSRVPFRF